MRDGGANHWDTEEILFSFFYTLGNGCWYFFGFTVAYAHHAFAIAYNDKRGKGEAASTLDHFGNAVDLYNAL